jgi:hypothetical protein
MDVRARVTQPLDEDKEEAFTLAHVREEQMRLGKVWFEAAAAVEQECLLTPNQN